MKKYGFVVLVLLIVSQSYAQDCYEENTKLSFSSDGKSLQSPQNDFIGDFWDNSWSIAPLAEYKPSNHLSLIDDNYTRINRIELGAALVMGETSGFHVLGIPLASEWYYFGPYLSSDIMYSSSALLADKRYYDNMPGVLLNIGATAGKGGQVLGLGLGASVNTAYSTDFTNSFWRIELGYDYKWIGLTFGKNVSLSEHGSNPAYLSSTYIGYRIMLWDLYEI